MVSNLSGDAAFLSPETARTCAAISAICSVNDRKTEPFYYTHLLSQVSARALLYGAYGKEHVQCLLASLAVAQSRHTVMARVERQIFELVALIYEDVVDAHLLEIHRSEEHTSELQSQR